MNLAALRKKKADALAAARAIHALAERENRDTTDAEDKDFDAHMALASSYDTKIAAAQLLAEADRTAPAIVASTAGFAAVAGHDRAEDRPWANAGEFLFAVKQAAVNGNRGADPRILAALGENESVASEGGILVPPQIAAGILQHTYDESVLADRCMEVPMETARLQMMAVDEKSRTNGARFGGMQAFWTGEADQYTATKPKFRALNLVANKLTALIYMTEELQADQSALQAYNDTVVPMELAYKIDDAILRGTGAGMPLGILNSPATIVVSKDAGQPASTVTTANILNMLSRVYARSLKSAAFFVNPAIIWTQLATLTIGTGTAVKLIFTPPDAGAPYGRLFGVPVFPIEQAAALGTQGDIVLADLQTYLLAKRQGIRADSSIHVQFVTGEIAYRWMMRLDGQPTWNAPLTPANGSISTSPYVVLQTRS